MGEGGKEGGKKRENCIKSSKSLNHRLVMCSRSM